MKFTNPLFTVVLLSFSACSVAAGDQTNQSFSKAKKNLERAVYQDYRGTIYCAATFDNKKMWLHQPVLKRKNIKREPSVLS